MLKKIALLGILFLSACNLQLVKEEKYIHTDNFRDEAMRLCLDSHKYKAVPDRQAACRQDAQAFITQAEKSFRDYKADEHNYRLCRSRFADIRASDKCFRQQQEKYYQRELQGYKAGLP